MPDYPETPITREEQYLAAALDGFEYDVLDEYAPEYRCTCSRERVERVLSSLSEDERREQMEAAENRALTLL